MENNNENHNQRLLSDEELFDSIPLGFRFFPTDCEVIEYYLKKKINGEKLPTNDIQEICINRHHPQELCTTGNRHRRGNNWYFFTARERKHKKGSTPNRQVKGQGYWKATGVDAKITQNGQIIGYKMTLDFYEEKGIKSQWKMHEYRIDRKSSPPDANCSSENQMELDKYVLCEIYINTTAKIDNNDEATNSPNNDIIIQAKSDNIDKARNSRNNDNIIDQEDLSPVTINMYPYEEKMDREQNFVGFKNNLEFGDQQIVQEITTTNFLSSSSNYVYHLPNYGDHSSVRGFQGFDELGAVIRGGARI